MMQMRNVLTYIFKENFVIDIFFILIPMEV